jgi:hypothetical protein
MNSLTEKKERATEVKVEPVKQTVYQAIAKVQAALAKEGIGKDRNNQQQGYKFRGIDDVYNALSSLLAENGLCILPRVLSRIVTERITKNGATLFYVVVDVEYDFVSASDGSKHTIQVCGEAMDSGDKATNKAMSAAYKYACLQTFCIPTEGDNDADATTHSEVAAAPVGTGGYKPVDPIRPHKDEYSLTVPVKDDGTLDFDHFAAELETKIDGAKNGQEVSLWNRANAKTLRAMEKERPDLFQAIGEKFKSMAQALM